MGSGAYSRLPRWGPSYRPGGILHLSVDLQRPRRSSAVDVCAGPRCTSIGRGGAAGSLPAVALRSALGDRALAAAGGTGMEPGVDAGTGGLGVVGGIRNWSSGGGHGHRSGLAPPGAVDQLPWLQPPRRAQSPRQLVRCGGGVALPDRRPRARDTHHRSRSRPGRHRRSPRRAVDRGQGSQHQWLRVRLLDPRWFPVAARARRGSCTCARCRQLLLEQRERLPDPVPGRSAAIACGWNSAGLRRGQQRAA